MHARICEYSLGSHNLYKVTASLFHPSTSSDSVLIQLVMDANTNRLMHENEKEAFAIINTILLLIVAIFFPQLGMYDAYIW